MVPRAAGATATAACVAVVGVRCSAFTFSSPLLLLLLLRFLLFPFALVLYPALQVVCTRHIAVHRCLPDFRCQGMRARCVRHSSPLHRRMVQRGAPARVLAEPAVTVSHFGLVSPCSCRSGSSSMIPATPSPWPLGRAAGVPAPPLSELPCPPALAAAARCTATKPPPTAPAPAAGLGFVSHPLAQHCTAIHMLIHPRVLYRPSRPTFRALLRVLSLLVRTQCCIPASGLSSGAEPTSPRCDITAALSVGLIHPSQCRSLPPFVSLPKQKQRRSQQGGASSHGPKKVPKQSEKGNRRFFVPFGSQMVTLPIPWPLPLV